eukprot:scaffold30246_cov79-Isochrysis_galbana.AAC.1
MTSTGSYGHPDLRPGDGGVATAFNRRHPRGLPPEPRSSTLPLLVAPPLLPWPITNPRRAS